MSTARLRQSWVTWRQRGPTPLPGLGTQGRKPSVWTATLSIGRLYFGLLLTALLLPQPLSSSPLTD